MNYQIIKSSHDIDSLSALVDEALAKDPALQPLGAPFWHAESRLWCQCVWRRPPAEPKGSIRLKEPAKPKDSHFSVG